MVTDRELDSLKEIMKTIVAKLSEGNTTVQELLELRYAYCLFLSFVGSSFAAWCQTTLGN